MSDNCEQVRLASFEEYREVASCMAAFRDFLGDSEPNLEQLLVGAYHAIANGLADFVVAGSPASSYVQLRYVWSAWHLAEVCWVEDLYVAESHRRQGIGKALMDFVIEHATSRGCVRLQLDANESNSPGTALYESVGFTNTNRWWSGGRDLFWVRPLR